MFMRHPVTLAGVLAEAEGLLGCWLKPREHNNGMGENQTRSAHRYTLCFLNVACRYCTNSARCANHESVQQSAITMGEDHKGL